MSIELTERAASKIQSIFQEHDMPVDSALRVGIRGGGCSGFSYTLDVTDDISEDEEVFESHGVKVCCDKKSHLYLNGTEIDYGSEKLQGGFVFNNPNATRSCGCGASFAV